MMRWRRIFEQQLRELTLLPLNIRRISLQAFQKEGCPRGRSVDCYPLRHAATALLTAINSCGIAPSQSTNSSRSARSWNHDAATTLAEGR
ncbi:stationary phase inducible protein CsiE [Salmonella enterica subsp. enterica]|uniref:Stationary phase inducible protein CsiE n=1 Tax=Salmonella enterica I TaxID=59201 RepID=A0A379WPR1_SALET|nr:stationary phase inducible protein CsiE [Salmonella enterica subsp. enterica]